MPLPELTPEQRAAALEKAAAARKVRAELREKLKSKGTTVGDVLHQGESDEIIGKMRVSAVLESLPGVGKARAAKIMERLEISPTRRVRGLGANQRKALEAEFASEPVAVDDLAANGLS
ncbi:integration host factor [Modestobacter sp. I12A-02628]|uniref:Integration host factor n=1 Tax=Goekera deserti TaxID=2497753 RepID=A0A7K3WBC4_9ACTN|nr:integration host factor, actinobacterial type [Goekera deserti]MPQ99143.1 integration host factor [Goekera deserti]NDI47478.1 integration host factor [Goekera deserti]NEL53289.1 integration host factor [Goekera deserti]